MRLTQHTTVSVIGQSRTDLRGILHADWLCMVHDLLSRQNSAPSKAHARYHSPALAPVPQAPSWAAWPYSEPP